MTNPKKGVDDNELLTSSEPITVWLIEDDPAFRETLERLLSTDPQIECRRSFELAEDAIEALHDDFAPEVMLIDLGLPGMSGIEALGHFKGASPQTHLVVLTVFNDDEKIFRAICQGASGYLLKPSSKETILGAIHSVRRGGAAINPYIAARVLEMFTKIAVPRGDYGLTNRETEILGILVEGVTKQSIADRLFLSPHTVDMHIRNIYSKLHVHSKTSAVAKALKERLI